MHQFKTCFTTFAVVAILLIAGLAQAQPVFDEIKMVGALNSTSEVTEFGWDQTPFLYLKLPENTADTSVFKNFNTTSAKWFDPSNVEQADTLSTTFTQREHWLSPSDWTDIRQVGVWDITADYSYTFGGIEGADEISFTVNPEPVSTILFLVGGAPLALAYRRKRKS